MLELLINSLGSCIFGFVIVDLFFMTPFVPKMPHPKIHFSENHLGRKNQK